MLLEHKKNLSTKTFLPSNVHIRLRSESGFQKKKIKNPNPLCVQFWFTLGLRFDQRNYPLFYTSLSIDLLTITFSVFIIHSARSGVHNNLCDVKTNLFQHGPANCDE